MITWNRALKKVLRGDCPIKIKWWRWGLVFLVSLYFVVASLALKYFRLIFSHTKIRQASKRTRRGQNSDVPLQPTPAVRPKPSAFRRSRCQWRIGLMDGPYPTLFQLLFIIILLASVTAYLIYSFIHYHCSTLDPSNLFKVQTLGICCMGWNKGCTQTVPRTHPPMF